MLVSLSALWSVAQIEGHQRRPVVTGVTRRPASSQSTSVSERRADAKYDYALFLFRLRC